MEPTPPTRAAGIRHIQEVLGITRDQTMVFGDFLNDLEMMDEATYSFAMANAHPDARRACPLPRAREHRERGGAAPSRASWAFREPGQRDFRPARPWVTGNLQTVADRLRPRRYDLEADRHRGAPDRAASDDSGDALAVRVHRPRIGRTPDRPLVLLVHGLGGTIDSHLRACDGGRAAACRVCRGAGRSAGYGRLTRALPAALPRRAVRRPARCAGGPGCPRRLRGAGPGRLVAGRERDAEAPGRTTGRTAPAGRGRPSARRWTSSSTSSTSAARMGGLYETVLMRGLRADTPDRTWC